MPVTLEYTHVNSSATQFRWIMMLWMGWEEVGLDLPHWVLCLNRVKTMKAAAATVLFLQPEIRETWLVGYFGDFLLGSNFKFTEKLQKKIQNSCLAFTHIPSCYHPLCVFTSLFFLNHMKVSWRHDCFHVLHCVLPVFKGQHSCATQCPVWCGENLGLFIVLGTENSVDRQCGWQIVVVQGGESFFGVHK